MQIRHMNKSQCSMLYYRYDCLYFRGKNIALMNGHFGEGLYKSKSAVIDAR